MLNRYFFFCIMLLPYMFKLINKINENYLKKYMFSVNCNRIFIFKHVFLLKSLRINFLTTKQMKVSLLVNHIFV